MTKTVEQDSRGWRHVCTQVRSTLLLGFTLCLAGGCGGENSETSEPMDEPRAPLLAGSDGYLQDYGLSCALDVEQTGDETSIVMRLRNHSSVPVSFLRRGTAWDHLGPIFNVSAGAVTAPYFSVFAYRLPPTDAEFQRVEPGATLVAAYNLTERHKISEGGAYDIALKQPALSVQVGGETLNLQHDCGSVRATLSSTPRSIGKAQEPLTFGSECTAVERAEVEYGKQAFRTILNIYPTHVTPTDSFFKEWFGAPGFGFAVRPLATFDAMNSRFDSWHIRCRVGELCTDSSIVAWVNASDDDSRINLCEPWFSLDASAFELPSSQVGTLVHEVSHLLGTDDFVISADAARALAVSDPNTATLSAENYEHFATHMLVVHAGAGILY